MTFIATVPEDEAEDAVKRGYDAARKMYGHIYQTTLMLSPWPEALTVEARRYQTLMLDESALTRAQKEMIATVVSVKNHCAYCYIHHMASMIDAGVEAGLARAIRDDYTTAAIDSKHRAMVEFVTMERPDQASQDHVDGLCKRGWSDRQILEITMIAALFEDYNTRVSLLGLEIEDWAGD